MLSGKVVSLLIVKRFLLLSRIFFQIKCWVVRKIGVIVLLLDLLDKVVILNQWFLLQSRVDIVCVVKALAILRWSGFDCFKVGILLYFDSSASSLEGVPDIG